MEAAGDSIDDRSAREDNDTASTCARQLFANDGRQDILKPPFMAFSMPALREMRRAREYCDVLFRTNDGGEFWGHRFVLAARYAGCGAFFSCSTKTTGFLYESRPERKNTPQTIVSEVVVRDLSSEMLDFLIDLAYHVPIHAHISQHNVREALDVAEALHMRNVRDHCLELLRKNLELDNCIRTYQFSSIKGYWTLSIDAFRFIVRNFDRVWATNPDFQSLMPDQLRNILYDDELHAPNEVECTFGAILKWIAGNVENRLDQLPRLLPLIRFAFCSREDMEKVESDPLVRASQKALEVLFIVKQTLSQRAVSDLYWSVRPDLFERRWLQPRVPKDVIFMFGGWTSGATNNLLTYNCRSSRWHLQPNQSTRPRAYHGVAILDDLIYFVGGFDGRDCYPTVVTLDVSRHKWSERSNMQVSRCYVSVAVLQGYIYAMGGFDGGEHTSSCERYDPRRNQWELVASMHAARSDACAVAAAGRIYIMGGFAGGEVLGSVERYDPTVDTWSYVVSLSSPRSGLKAIVHDDIIYVMGGFDGAFRLETVEMMDARRGRWSELPSMNLPRSNFVAVLLEGSIYVAGGFDGGSTVSLVERYDIQGRQWYPAPDLTISCCAAAACVYQDTPNPRSWL